jgi:hypothetical protein
MTEEVKNKLEEFFKARIEETQAFYSIIRDYFSKDLTDLQLPTFNQFLDKVGDYSLCYFIEKAQDSNSHGSYSIDQDYYNNHINDDFLESITDLGIIDYCYEDLLDEMPLSYIIIKFPEVTVTNEYNRSTVIKDLFVELPMIGNLLENRFRMIRTTYDISQWLCGYSHSHLPRIHYNSIPYWKYPCLGSGPLKSTIAALQSSYDEEFVGLFCLELSKYVTVESLAGIPHIRLEGIGANNNNILKVRNYKGRFMANRGIINPFFKYYIEHNPIKIAYVNSNYVMGESLTDLWIKLSNSFIEWANNNIDNPEYVLQEWLNSGFLHYVIINNGIVYKNLEQSVLGRINTLNGTEMFNFKGVIQKLTIENVVADNENKTLLLSPEVCEYFVTIILKLINYKYDGTITEEGETEPHKKCFYL